MPARLPKPAKRSGVFIGDHEVPYNAFGCLGARHPVRSACITAVQSSWFNGVFALVVIINTIILCAYNPTDYDGTSLRNRVLTGSSVPFTVLFTLEMLVRTVAMGAWGRGSYFTDKWNVLGFIVVVTSWLSLSPALGNLTGLRLLHLIRLVAVFPPMRLVLDSIFGAAPGLAVVGLLSLAIYYCFATIGLQLWSGQMGTTCVYEDPATGSFVNTGTPCGMPSGCSATNPSGLTVASSCSVPNWGDVCDPINVWFNGTLAGEYNRSSANALGGGDGVVTVNTSCTFTGNPDYGQTSFDNIGAGLLESFVLITTEGWTGTMYTVFHTWGVSPLVAFLFTSHVYLGAFVIAELTLGVVWASYRAVEQASKANKKQRMRRTMSVIDIMKKTGATSGSGGATGDGGHGQGHHPHHHPHRPQLLLGHHAPHAHVHRGSGQAAAGRVSATSHGGVATASTPTGQGQGAGGPAAAAAGRSGSATAAARAHSPLTMMPASPLGAAAGRASAASPSGPVGSSPSSSTVVGPAGAPAATAGAPAPASGPPRAQARASLAVMFARERGQSVVAAASSSSNAGNSSPASTGSPFSSSRALSLALGGLPPSGGSTRSLLAAAGAAVGGSSRSIMGGSAASASTPSSTASASSAAGAAGCAGDGPAVPAAGAPAGGGASPATAGGTSATPPPPPALVPTSGVPAAGDAGSPTTQHPSGKETALSSGSPPVPLAGPVSTTALALMSPAAQTVYSHPARRGTGGVRAALGLAERSTYPLASAPARPGSVAAAAAASSAAPATTVVTNPLAGGPSVALVAAPAQNQPAACDCRATCRSCLVSAGRYAAALGANSGADASNAGGWDWRKTWLTFVAWYIRAVPPLPTWFTKPLNALVSSSPFRVLVFVVIITNALALGMDDYEASATTSARLAIANDFFAGFYMVETLLRLLAAGLRGYLQDGFNRFDLLIVGLSLLDVLVTAGLGRGTAGAGYSGLRAVRVIRLLRLGRVSSSLRRIMLQLWQAVVPALNSLLLLMVIQLCLAVLGMQMFGGRAYENAVQAGILEEIPRLNFNSLWCALLTVFVVGDNENWDGVLHSHMAVFGAKAFFFFMVIIILFNYYFLNIMMAVLVENFANAKVETAVEEGLTEKAKRLALTAWTAAMAPGGCVERLRSACCSCACCGAPAGRKRRPSSVSSPLSSIPPKPAIHDAAAASTTQQAPGAARSPSVSMVAIGIKADTPSSPDDAGPAGAGVPASPGGFASVVKTASAAKGGGGGIEMTTLAAGGFAPAPAATAGAGTKSGDAAVVAAANVLSHRLRAGRHSTVAGIAGAAMAAAAAQSAAPGAAPSAAAAPGTASPAPAAAADSAAAETQPRVPGRVGFHPEHSRSRRQSMLAVAAGKVPPLATADEPPASAASDSDASGAASPACTARSPGDAPGASPARQSPAADAGDSAPTATGATLNPLHAAAASASAATSALAPSLALSILTRNRGDSSSSMTRGASPQIDASGADASGSATGRSSSPLMAAGTGSARTQSNRRKGGASIVLDSKQGRLIGVQAVIPSKAAQRPASPADGAAPVPATGPSLRGAARNVMKINALRAAAASGAAGHDGKTAAAAGFTGAATSAADSTTATQPSGLPLAADGAGKGAAAAATSDSAVSIVVDRTGNVRVQKIVTQADGGKGSQVPRGLRRLTVAARGSKRALTPPSTPNPAGGGSSKGITLAPAEDGNDEEDEPLGCLCCMKTAWETLVFASKWLSRNVWFERFSIFIILLSCLNLAIEDPAVRLCRVIPRGTAGSCYDTGQYLYYTDIVITSFFTLELVMAFCIHTWRLPLDMWRFLDLVVTVVSIATLAAPDGTTRALRSARTLRALRPLRLVSFFPHLKLVLDAIFASLPGMKDVFLLVFLIVYIFAVAGMQTYKGALGYCSDPSVALKAACTGTFNATGSTCILQPTVSLQEECALYPWGMPFPRIWTSYPENFNTLGSSLLTMFELASAENWPVFTTYGLDATGSDQPQRRDASPSSAFFYVLVVLACNFFLVELFAGVVVDTYNRLRSDADGSAMLTPDQRVWVSNMRTLLTVQLPRPARPPPTPRFPWISRVRTFFYRVYTHKAYDYVALANLVVYLALVSSKHPKQTNSYTTAQSVGSRVTACLFTLEILTGIVAIGVVPFFRSWRHRVDLVTIPCAIIGAFWPEGIVAAIFRIVAALRVFELLRLSVRAQRLVSAIVFSLPALANVTIILMLDFFIYSVMGMNTFSGVRYAITGVLDADANFDSFGLSFLTLLRAATGENFNLMLHDLAIQSPYCIPSGQPGANCGTRLWISSLFWVSFFTITAFILLNMVTAVVLEAYDQMSEHADGHTASGAYRLTHDHADAFAHEWSRFDQDADMALPVAKVVEVVAKLPYPLGVKDAPALLLKQKKADDALRRANAQQALRAKRRPAKVSNLVPASEAVQLADARARTAAGFAAVAATSTPVDPAASHMDLHDVLAVPPPLEAGAPRSAVSEMLRAGRHRAHRVVPAWMRVQVPTDDVRMRLAVAEAERRLYALDLCPDDHGRLQFHAVLHALAESAGHQSALGERIAEVQVGGGTSTGRYVSLRRDMAARRVIAAWRHHVYLRRLAADPASPQLSAVGSGVGPRIASGHVRFPSRRFDPPVSTSAPN